MRRDIKYPSSFIVSAKVHRDTPPKKGERIQFRNKDEDGDWYTAEVYGINSAGVVLVSEPRIMSDFCQGTSGTVKRLKPTFMQSLFGSKMRGKN